MREYVLNVFLLLYVWCFLTYFYFFLHPEQGSLEFLRRHRRRLMELLITSILSSIGLFYLLLAIYKEGEKALDKVISIFVLIFLINTFFLVIRTFFLYWASFSDALPEQKIFHDKLESYARIIGIFFGILLAFIYLVFALNYLIK